MGDLGRLQRFYESWQGKPLGSLPSVQPGAAVVKAVGESFHSRILRRGDDVARQVMAEAVRAGIRSGDLQYVFFTLVENPRSWPTMNTRSRDALRAARLIMERAGATPPYDDGLALPDMDDESRVDSTLTGVAFWAASRLAGSLNDDFQASVREQVPALQRAVGKSVPQGALFTLLAVAFQRATADYQHWFPADADLLYLVTSKLLPEYG